MTRYQRIERAFFRGGSLTFENSAYCKACLEIPEILFQEDYGTGDLTASALDLTPAQISAAVVARQEGIIAGLQEFAEFYGRHGVEVSLERTDGEAIQPGEVVLRAEGDRTRILALERVGLNLLQRMSGIASSACCLQQRLQQGGSGARIIGTRKTPWGLLDKRALHLGGTGTHRLSLGDAVLIKNNHLALLAATEESAAPLAIQRAWKSRAGSAFIEIEIRSEAAARAAALAFAKLLESQSEEYPCVLMLDNMTPSDAASAIRMLREEGLWDSILIEVSGGITGSSAMEYAAAGVDVISIGALTHSVRALDLCQRIS